MGTSRGLAVLYLLLVISGGTILAADTVFDFTVSTGDYTVPFGLSGLMFLGGGIFSLMEVADRQRTRAVGWFGLAVGLGLIIVVDGFVAQGPFIYYVGIAVLVLTGIVLFFMRSDSGQQSTNAS